MGHGSASTRTSQALVRLQTNQFYFSNLIFNTDCPHCHLQVISLDLLCPDITVLYRPFCICFTAQKCKEWKNRYIISLSKHLRCQVAVLSSATADRLDWTDRWTLQCSMLQSRWEVCTIHKAVTAGSMSSMGLLSQEVMCRGTFVRLCGHPAHRLVHQDTPFRRPVSVKWHQKHSDIWFEWAERPDWGRICTTQI